MSAFARELARFRLRPPAEVLAETEAHAACVLAPLDALVGDFSAVLGRMYATVPGLDRRKTPRREAAR